MMCFSVSLCAGQFDRDVWKTGKLLHVHVRVHAYERTNLTDDILFCSSKFLNGKLYIKLTCLISFSELQCFLLLF